MTAAGGGANRSDCHAADQWRRARRRKPRPSSNPMSCCGRSRPPPSPRFVTAVVHPSHFLAALLWLLCLLVVIGQEVHCQSSPPLRHVLRSRQQDPSLESSSNLPFIDETYASHDVLATTATGRRRELVTTIRYTNSTLPRRSAVAIYRSFCPVFVWKKGGCTASQKSVKGSGGAIAATSSSTSSLRWSQCGYTHVLQRYDITIGQQQTTFRYTASRNGIPYSRKLAIVCPHSTKMYVGLKSLSFARPILYRRLHQALVVCSRANLFSSNINQHPQLYRIELVVRRVGTAAQASHVQTRQAATHAHAVPDAGADPLDADLPFVPHPADLDVRL
jgi:hypothetical protein